MFNNLLTSAVISVFTVGLVVVICKSYFDVKPLDKQDKKSVCVAARTLDQMSHDTEIEPADAAKSANDKQEDRSAVLKPLGKSLDYPDVTILDNVSHQWLKYELCDLIHDQEGTSTVFLAIGNSYQTSDQDWTPSRVENVTNVIKLLGKKGFRVSYDADSPILAKIVNQNISLPGYPLGISHTNKESSDHTIVIQDPTKYFNTILHFKKVFISSDSFVGAALVLNSFSADSRGQPDLLTFERYPDHVWKFEKLVNWSTHFTETGLGAAAFVAERPNTIQELINSLIQRAIQKED